VEIQKPSMDEPILWFADDFPWGLVDCLLPIGMVLMKTSVAILSTIILFLSAWMLTQKAVYGDDPRYDNLTQETLTELANCLTEKGWVMYGSFTCSACRAERNAFGKGY
jgi:hypothetical protein